MAKSYNQYKVSELKEFLQKRGLPVNGTKSELISRLNESDANAAEATPETADVAPEEAAPAEAEPIEEATSNQKDEQNSNEAESAAEPTEAATEPTEATVQPETAPAPIETAESKEEDEIPITTEDPQPTEEELFNSMSEDLKKRISRTERFGGDATELKAKLRRLEKFGVVSILDANAKAAKTAVKGTPGVQKQHVTKKGKNNKNRVKSSATA